MPYTHRFPLVLKSRKASVKWERRSCTLFPFKSSPRTPLGADPLVPFASNRRWEARLFLTTFPFTLLIYTRIKSGMTYCCSFLRYIGTIFVSLSLCSFVSLFQIPAFIILMRAIRIAGMTFYTFPFKTTPYLLPDGRSPTFIKGESKCLSASVPKCLLTLITHLPQYEQG